MRYIPLIFIISMIAAGSCYSLLNYKPLSDRELNSFLSISCEIIHVYDDGSIDFIANEHEYDILLQAGIPFTTRIDDLGRFYNNRYDGGGRNTGIYMTWSEISAWMDELHSTYPYITSSPTSIGNTIEGRPQTVVKLSANSSFWVDDPTLPNCWYDGLIHAREPASMRNLRFFMQWLCENYNRNGFCGLQATYVLDNRELWCLPCNNVDGYVYNEPYSYGNGMWRKNRRDNGGGIYGVDLNRNWSVGWGGAGSSGNPSSSTYRGTGPLSEPEAGNIDVFWQDHPPVQMHSTHTYGNILIYPWGWTDDPTTHVEQYDTQGEIMVQWGTGELHGPSAQINYYSSGNTRDHAYGLYGAMSWNHETGASFAGFWPSDIESFKLSRRNLRSYLVTAFLAGCPLDPHVPDIVVIDEIGPVSIPFTINWSMASMPATYALQELTGYEVLLDDDGSGGPFNMNNWSTTTSQYHSGPSSYLSGGTGTMTWTETVAIPENGGGRLSFWAYYDIPVGSCQGSIEVSDDGGDNWYYLQTFGRTDLNWRLSIHELDEWQGDTLSFRWETTGSASDLYIDDIMVEVWEENEFVDLDIPVNSYTFTEHESGEFWYRVVTMDPDFGPSWPSDAVLAQINLGISPEVHPSGHTSLGHISPNPVSGMACIPVTISSLDAGSADLAIYDLSGRRVVDISSQINTPGAHTAYWNCTDSNGTQVPGGLYFCVLEASHTRLTRRAVVVW
ncbi:MAG: hypothetical protein KAW14_09970 [Candidatus Aegiribacteria sp.]|nr:hypothetical protein [Candidatus Aegiribacteria sp.]